MVFHRRSVPETGAMSRVDEDPNRRYVHSPRVLRRTDLPSSGRDTSGVDLFLAENQVAIDVVAPGGDVRFDIEILYRPIPERHVLSGTK